MAHTLERAVASVAEQLDERFEIVLIDDGSSDDSASIMEHLAARYPIIRVIPLKRDGNRKLGETRNISIRRGKGKYCLLHIDCDDIWEPHLIGWVEIFHQIEAAIGTDVLIAGRQVHMAKRSLLLEHGPYPNIFRGEDRGMYARFGAHEVLWFLNHQCFRTRLPHPTLRKSHRTIVHTFDHMTTDFRLGEPFIPYIRAELSMARCHTRKWILFRLSMIPVTWLFAD